MGYYNIARYYLLDKSWGENRKKTVIVSLKPRFYREDLG